jgi:NAD(P)H-hydrate epimerase
MKVLTPAEMREVDRKTIELGIPGLILMENAASRVVEFLVERFSPLDSQRIVLICGKGNNGGDGLAIARQLVTRFRPQSLDVFLTAEPNELQGDAAANHCMYLAAGGTFAPRLEVAMGAATLVIDALLGTGLRGNVEGVYRDWIRAMNSAFPMAKRVAVDITSGLGTSECVRADYTITFTAPKVAMVESPGCELCGELIVAPIGSPASLLASAQVNLSEASDFAAMLAPRTRDSNKGLYGHVLIVGGGQGKTGSVGMSGLAALRVGAGLVTVAASDHTGFALELMHAKLSADLPLERKTVVAIGPGLGTDPASVELVRHALETIEQPLVVDADGLTNIAGMEWKSNGRVRVLTPHPGEMERLVPGSLLADRITTARNFATSHECCVILKGNRTVIAFADGQVWINPTGSPAMSKAGSGDILTGLVAGMLAQYPSDWQTAVRAAVYWHGLAGERAARVHGEKGVLATDLVRYLFPCDKL